RWSEVLSALLRLLEPHLDLRQCVRRDSKRRRDVELPAQILFEAYPLAFVFDRSGPRAQRHEIPVMFRPARNYEESDHHQAEHRGKTKRDQVSPMQLPHELLLTVSQKACFVGGHLLQSGPDYSHKTVAASGFY